MRNIKFFFVIFLFCFSTGIFSQSRFEGKVVYQFEEDGESQVFSYLAKDSKFRIDVPDTEGTFIYDIKAGKMIMVMDEEKMYMEMPVDMNKAVQESIEESDETFTKTGESKEILGYKCDKFLFTSDDMKGEAWMTKELGGIMLFDDPEKMQSSGQAWKQEILEQGYMPLVVNELDENGKVTSTFKVLEVEPKKLDAKLFQAPPDYQKFEMPNMNIDSFK